MPAATTTTATTSATTTHQNRGLTGNSAAPQRTKGPQGTDAADRDAHQAARHCRPPHEHRAHQRARVHSHGHHRSPLPDLAHHLRKDPPPLLGAAAGARHQHHHHQHNHHQQQQQLPGKMSHKQSSDI